MNGAGVILEKQRAAFIADGIPDAATRIDRVRRLQALLIDNSDALCAALTTDFGTRPRELSMVADVLGCMTDLEHQRKHLRRWMRTEHPVPGLAAAGLRFGIRHDPKGVVGILGPWNFPLQLTIVPAGSALAAGNRVVLRPSSVTAATAELLAQLAPKYFAVEELAVITRDQATGAEFAKLAFDHLFFTGSPEVGASVAAEAGANLVPVTLELGGKNPVVVDRDANIAKAAVRVADARMINSGQVCLCPDYVFVPSEMRDDFVTAVLARWRTSFPSVVANDQYTSIIDDRNFERIVGLVDEAKSRGATVHRASPAGEPDVDATSRKIAPTLLTDVTDEMEIESTEIFGPVLVVHPYDRLDQAVQYIRDRPHPLTLYWFGPDNERYRHVQDHTVSGSVNANDAMLNMFTGKVPFGGVGRSGMGHYHGRFGFDTFSHARTVAYSRLPISLSRFATAPFSRLESKFVDLQLAAYRRGRRCG